MGLIKAVLNVAISIAIVNMIYKYKIQLAKYPILNRLLPYLDGSKCYIIILMMFLIMVLI